jgi:U3 small nucleolar RNA-associated protein 22
MERVAKNLQEQGEKLGRIEYIWSKGMNRPPHLQLIPPSKKKAPKFQIHLHFGMSSIDWIPRLRLVPNRCNIKDDSKGQLYNHCLCYDSRHEFEDTYLHDLAEHPNVKAALVLIQVWALQRGIWRNHDGWTKENVALLMVYLLRTHKMNARMTPVQIFTVVLQTWATIDWMGEETKEHSTFRAAHSEAAQFLGGSSQRRAVLILPLEGITETETIRQSQLAGLYEQQTKESPLTEDDLLTLMDTYSCTKFYSAPVFLDPTMTYNYLGSVSPNYMSVLQSHARKSLEALKNSRSAFGYLFMKPARFWSQWDIFIQIPIKSGCPEEWEFSVRRLVRTLELALGTRIHGLRVLSTGNGDTSSGRRDIDQYPSQTVSKLVQSKRSLSLSPTGTNKIVLGISVNPEPSQRVVDRGPPSDKHEEVKSFIKLWGKKAQLRRFKDGAIVQAVVWNEGAGKDQFQNADKLRGGYVENIVRHIVHLHYTKEAIKISLPSLLSVVDGIRCEDKSLSPFLDPLAAHQNIMKAFESLSDFLRKNSKQTTQGSLDTAALGLPLSIDAVEPLSPCLRYSELYPPLPHPFLGGSTANTKKVSGAIVSDPILIQVRFGSSSKWPTDLKAIGAAKTAMLIQLANGIETSGEKSFDGPIVVTPTYADLGYKGYCFRVLVRADPEIRMLQGLVKPSAVASNLLKDLTKRHLVAARHHSTIHAVHTLHPSAASVVRIAKRWVAGHLLSGLISDEAIELMVAKVYSYNEAVLEPPGTTLSGFLKFLHLLATHDWARLVLMLRFKRISRFQSPSLTPLLLFVLREPLVVNPRGHISDDEYDEINHEFEKTRGENMDGGPPMYIIAPYDKADVEDGGMDSADAVQAVKETEWHASVDSPEWVVVTRAVSLAKRSYDFMYLCLTSFDETDWSAVFHETASAFKSYSILFRVSSEFVVDVDSSSTGGNLDISVNVDDTPESSFTLCMKSRFQGPKSLRRKVYRNLRADVEGEILYSWRPVQLLVDSLRRKFGTTALFFYNAFSPEVIGVVWRPKTFPPKSFSVMASEYARPTGGKWKSDSLVVRNASDLLREMSQFHKDIVTTVKVFDERYMVQPSKRRKIIDQQSRDEIDEDEILG